MKAQGRIIGKCSFDALTLDIQTNFHDNVTIKYCTTRLYLYLNLSAHALL